MSILQGLESMFGGSNPQTPAAQAGGESAAGGGVGQSQVQQMLSRMEPQQLQQIFTDAARRADPQEYAQHITPGAGGTNPLGGIGAGGLSTIASLLLQHLGNKPGGIGALLTHIPGLQTADPNQMNENDVARLAQYAQQNHPDVFGHVAAVLGQQHPGLLGTFLGKSALSQGIASLASHFLSNMH